jgi:hypothetical protein
MEVLGQVCIGGLMISSWLELRAMIAASSETYVSLAFGYLDRCFDL